MRGFVCYFYSEEGNEPAHVHVDRGDGTAKFWLEPLRLAYSYGLKPAELKLARQIIFEHQALLLRKWHEYFG